MPVGNIIIEYAPGNCPKCGTVVPIFSLELPSETLQHAITLPEILYENQKCNRFVVTFDDGRFTFASNEHMQTKFWNITEIGIA